MSAPPDPLAAQRGPTSKGRGRDGREGNGREGKRGRGGRGIRRGNGREVVEGKGEGWEGEEGKPTQASNSKTAYVCRPIRGGKTNGFLN